MHRLDSGLVTGQSLFKRQASEGKYEYMESGSREPEGASPTEENNIDGIRKLCRAVIVRALRDLGGGLERERNDVWNWVNSEGFEQVRGWAGWDDDWILDVFRGVYNLNKSVRKRVTHECVLMLKTLSETE